MAVRDWTGAISTDGNATGNYTGSGAFLTTDDLTYGAAGAARACTFTGALSVKSLTVSSAYTNAFNDGGQTLTLAGGFSFATGPSSYTFTGTIKPTATGTWSSVANINNLEAAGGLVTYTVSGTVTIAGTFTNSQTGTGTVNTGTLVFQGNIAGAGAGAFGGTSGTAAFQFTGTGDKTFTFGATTFGTGGGTILINKVSGTITLQQNSTWLGSTTITSGTLNCNTKTWTCSTSGNTLTINGGTLTGSSASISIGHFLLSSGVYSATTGTTTVANFTVSGGTFTHNNGTVLVGVSGATSTINCTQSFYTINIVNSATGVVEAGSVLTCDGNFAFSGSTAGAIFDTKNFNLIVTGTITIAKIFKRSGDESITYGTLTISSGSTTVYIATSGTRALAAWSYDGLQISGSGGTFSLGANLTITGTFIMAAGTFTQNAKTLTAAGLMWTGGTITEKLAIATGGTTWYVPMLSETLTSVASQLGTGTFSETARNRDPVYTNVQSGTGYYSLGIQYVGTL